MAQEARIRITADVAKAIAELQKLERESSSATSKIERSFEKMSKGTLVVGGALGAAGAAGTAFIGSATKLAARVETLGVVLTNVGRNAGYSASALREFEASVIAQGITTQAARQSLARLAQSNNDLSNASKLARIAQDAAVIAGINSSEAFERMILGINNLNPLILRNMRIMINLEAAYSSYAEQNGIAANEIDILTKKQIATNEVLEQGERIFGTYSAAMETAGKKAASLDRHLEESRRIIGEAYLPMYAGMVDVTTDLLQSFEDLGAGQQRQIAATVGMGTAWAAASGSALLLVSQGATLIVTLRSLGVAASSALGPIGLVTGALAILTTAFISSRAGLQALRDEFSNARQMVQDAGGGYQDYRYHVLKAAEGTSLWHFAIRMANETGREFGPVLEELLLKQGMLTEAQFRGINAAQGWTTATYEAYRGIQQMSEGQRQAISTTERLQAEFDRYKQELEGIPPNKHTTITADATGALRAIDRVIGAMNLIPGVTLVALPGSGTVVDISDPYTGGGNAALQSYGGYRQLEGGFAGGGRLPRQGIYSVGEEGFELVINGVVVPHGLSKTLLALGLQPGGGFALQQFDSGGSTTTSGSDSEFDPLNVQHRQQIKDSGGSTAPATTTTTTTSSGGTSPVKQEAQKETEKAVAAAVASYATVTDQQRREDKLQASKEAREQLAASRRIEALLEQIHIALRLQGTHEDYADSFRSAVELADID